MDVMNRAEVNGRVLEFFTNESLPEWGYTEKQFDTFAILHPKDEKAGEKYPLDVVFHSAGHDVYSTISCIIYPGNHDIYHTPENMYGLFLDCRAHANDWWWGGMTAQDGPDSVSERRGTKKQPVENRCMATIDWTFEHYPIDKNRVYAVGNSMGGSGSLGVALCRGDVFAAIKANVPAGVRHAADRCCLDTEAPAGFKIPDPPIVVDYSAQNDDWSNGHEVLYKGMHDKKYQIFGFWGKFGHANNNSEIAKVNDLIHSVDIWSFRLDEAYPVFTDATTDDPIPWPERTSPDAGQKNAFFRWSNIKDTEKKFEITLKLLEKSEWETRVDLPEESTANVTFRRLQNFKLNPGEEFRWSYAGQSGKAKASADGRPELSGITVKQTAQTLVLERL